MYHNTTNLHGADLSRATNAALKQEDRILAFFEQYKGFAYSPSFVWNITGMKLEGAPITSVRRTMTDLTKGKKLKAVPGKVDGPFGRPEGLWTYVEPAVTKLF